MSTRTTACNVAVDARADSAGPHARWLALTCSPEQVHVSGRYAARRRAPPSRGRRWRWPAGGSMTRCPGRPGR